MSKRHFGYVLSCAALAMFLGACGEEDSGSKTKAHAGGTDGPDVECYTIDDCNELYPGGVNPV